MVTTEAGPSGVHDVTQPVPSPSAVALRFYPMGQRRRGRLLEDLEDLAADGKTPALSVWVFEPLDGEVLDELVVRALPLVPLRNVQSYWASTATAILAAGFRMISTEPKPYHYDVVFEAVDSAEVDRFIAAFGEKRRSD